MNLYAAPVRRARYVPFLPFLCIVLLGKHTTTSDYVRRIAALLNKNIASSSLFFFLTSLESSFNTQRGKQKPRKGEKKKQGVLIETNAVESESIKVRQGSLSFSPLLSSYILQASWCAFLLLSAPPTSTLLLLRALYSSSYCTTSSRHGSRFPTAEARLPIH